MTRPSGIAAKEEDCAIGFDIGGTKIAAGVVTETGRILHKQVAATPRPADATILQSVVLELARELMGQYPDVSAVGAGAAGLIDWPSGYIRWAPNSAYANMPLQKILAAETGLPAAVENDANAAAWAEAHVGVGMGYHDVIVLTVGTGIGGGIILNGALHRGGTGIGGEVGHIIVNPISGPQCGCGIVGCLESMASGTALARAGRAAAVDDPSGVIANLAASIDKVTGETVFQAACQGDLVAKGLFDQIGYWLGVGIASLATVFDPDLVIITGGLASTGDLLFHPTRASFEHYIFARKHRSLPPVLPALLGTDSGLIGAALLALDRRINHQSDNPNQHPGAILLPHPSLG